MSCIFVVRWVSQNLYSLLNVILSRHLYPAKSRQVPVIFPTAEGFPQEDSFWLHGAGNAYVHVQEMCLGQALMCALAALGIVFATSRANESHMPARQRTSPRKARYLLSRNSSCSFWKFTIARSWKLRNNSNFFCRHLHMFLSWYTGNEVETMII